MRDREVEAKFMVKHPSAARAVARLQTLGPFRWKSRFRQRQTNLYLDTPDFRLRGARAALKLRRVGERSEGTFKTELGYRGGVSRRVEVAVPIGARQVRCFLAGELECSPIRRARKIVGLRPLVRVLTLRTDRKGWIFGAGRERVELVLDRVRVERQGRRAGVYQEIELENRSASESSFRKGLTVLRRALGKGARPCRIPKYEIGLRMVRGRRL